MRALVVDHDARGRLSVRDVPEPSPGADQVLVKVAATSLNHGELPREQTPTGEIHGWDAAGVVVTPAASGRGPQVGARVVTRSAAGGWAELRVAHVDDVAVLPERLEFGAAAALPIAGVSALRALRRLRGVVGRRVLITGASGGVGRFAVQLAQRAGAHVIAVVGSRERAKGLERLGADEIVLELSGVHAPVFGVIDNVGGGQLVESFALLEPGGSVVCVGAAAREPAVFPPYATVGPERSIVSFVMGAAIGSDMGYLAALVERGELDPQIGWRGPLEAGGEAAEALLARKVLGKVVLDVA